MVILLFVEGLKKEGKKTLFVVVADCGGRGRTFMSSRPTRSIVEMVLFDTIFALYILGVTCDASGYSTLARSNYLFLMRSHLLLFYVVLRSNNTYRQ
jgi:hypothetical protein